MEVLTYLRETIDLKPTDRVADVGSGTGFLSELFLSNRNRVIGVEPNVEMRSAAEAIMADSPEFISQDGAAEATGLVNASVDLVVAGQAFHWFDPVKTKTEFRRVLKPGGQVALIWNVCQLDGSQFMQAYETMLRS